MHAQFIKTNPKWTVSKTIKLFDIVKNQLHHKYFHWKDLYFFVKSNKNDDENNKNQIKLVHFFNLTEIMCVSINMIHPFNLILVRIFGSNIILAI